MKFLIVVDMQVDFISGSLGSDMAKAIVPEVVKKVRGARGLVIFTRDTHGEDYMSTQEGRKLPVEHCIKGSDGWQICEELRGYARRVVDKPTFGSVDLPEILRAYCPDGETVEEIELCGLCTDICVVSNALILKAKFPALTVKINAPLCVGTSSENHNAALQTMRMCQCEVLD